jgi:short-subunit dehydrogenase
LQKRRKQIIDISGTLINICDWIHKTPPFFMAQAQKLAIVTGSSKGIGLETSKILLSNGYRVAGLSRSKTSIQNENFKHYSIDLLDLEKIKETFQAITSDFNQSCDVLVNNAGFGVQGLMHVMKDEDWFNMFNLNVNALYLCSKAVIPGMIEKEQGHIINISSIAGLNGIETMSGYCGSKHAVRGISHSMYKELRNYGIKVSCIYPGSVNTHFFDGIESVTANQNMMRPQDIAQSIFDIINTHVNYHVVDVEVRPLKPKG